jgi:ATP-binding cassette subfamily B protein
VPFSVATRCWRTRHGPAGRVINTIVQRSAPDVVVGRSSLIAVIAIAEPGSAWPLAGYQRVAGSPDRGSGHRSARSCTANADRIFTRTGTLQPVEQRCDRFAVDVQQHAVQGGHHLATLVLRLVVMIGISWQITPLALVLLLPVFVLPARRMGTRLAQLQGESANHNAVMTTHMTERFSAPGRPLRHPTPRNSAGSSTICSSTCTSAVIDAPVVVTALRPARWRSPARR